MKPFVQIAVLLIVGMLFMPAVPHADQAQYFYDELGRLVGVVDGSGNAAVYVYDEVATCCGLTALPPVRAVSEFF